MRRALIAIVLLFAGALTLFSQQTPSYTIRAVPRPEEGGTVTGAGVYPPGTKVTLIATPSFGYRFVRWTEGGEEVSTAQVLTFVVDRSRELTAEFETVPWETGLGGRWEGSLQLLPSPIELSRSRLEIDYSLGRGAFKYGLTISASLSSSGWGNVNLRGNLAWGPIRATGGLVFDPAGPEYKSAYFATNFSWEGSYLSLRVNHYAFGGVPPGPYLTYGLTVRSGSLSANVRFQQREGGIEFQSLTANLSGLALCCGISLSGCLGFTKSEGFSYLSLSARNLFELCCGVTLDAGLKLTPLSKQISLRPRVPSWGDACLRIYGDVAWDEETYALQGIELYGWKIRCCLKCGACPGARVSSPYLEVVSALAPQHVPGGFRGDEFEYWRFGSCGPACCGGYWTLEGTVFFSHSGGLLGISRAEVKASLPLGRGWVVKVDLPLPDMGLTAGWSWQF